MVLRIVRSHHERMDGCGFPDGLAGDRIPREARIVAVVDAFDAIDESHKRLASAQADRIAAVIGASEANLTYAAVENATRIGQEIAERLKAAGVTGVILTST